jgi:hypothetical protein
VANKPDEIGCTGFEISLLRIYVWLPSHRGLQTQGRSLLFKKYKFNKFQEYFTLKEDIIRRHLSQLKEQEPVKRHVTLKQLKPAAS